MSGFVSARQKMVDGQVRTSDVTDHRIIDAMLAVPREDFVPESKRALAYLDLDLDVSENAAVKRYLLKPQLTAKLLQAAGIAASDSILIVGCATGYVAALAARLAAKVTAIETDSALVARGQAALRGTQNVTLKTAELLRGDPDNAPYDAIILNGATETTTENLCGQLKEGGRLVGVFATTRPPRAMVVTRSHGEFGTRVLFDASAPILPGFERVPAFVF
ncbi:MAG TPA: methyltransferase domain-containing protein [Bradyrhizobium sp.]|nr:methyltransferase domain-containing protein [Bradyrhizobium sp.]